jgi:hypothetical protein
MGSGSPASSSAGKCQKFIPDSHGRVQLFHGIFMIVSRAAVHLGRMNAPYPAPNLVSFVLAVWLA